MANLEITSPGEGPRSVELTTDLTVGRTQPAGLVLADAKISRRHCQIVRNETGWQVEDLGSSNGTRIAGKVVKSHLLRDGDCIEVGLSRLVFRAPLAPPPAPIKRSESARERLVRKRRR